MMGTLALWQAKIVLYILSILYGRSLHLLFSLATSTTLYFLPECHTTDTESPAFFASFPPFKESPALVSPVAGDEEHVSSLSLSVSFVPIRTSPRPVKMAI